MDTNMKNEWRRLFDKYTRYWKIGLGVSVCLLIVLVVAGAIHAQNATEIEEDPRIRNVIAFGISTNSLCANCHTCMSLADCREIHPNTHLTDLQTCHRGGFCCPQYQQGQAPPSCHKNYHLLPRPGACGISSVARDNRISQGTQAYPGELPWMALLGTRRNSSHISWSCGGTLVSNRYVLTAAHCVDNNRIDIDVVRLRDHNVKKATAEDCYQDRCVRGDPLDLSIEKVVVHEQWRTRGKHILKNDIALIRLSEDVPITFEKSIYPICLPLESDDITYEHGKRYEIAGWGTNGDVDIKMSDALMVEYIKGRSFDECNICHSGSTSVYCPLTADQICVQGEYGVDVCEGDSGGPLMDVQVHQTWQVGITSFSPMGCGLNGIPSVFTNISSYTSWILDSIES